MDWRIKLTNIRYPMLKLKAHSGYHDFDSDMSKSTNTVVYFDWKTVIYIYFCGKCRTQFMLPMKKSVTFTGACANEIIPSINRSFVYKAKEGGYVRIKYSPNLKCYRNTNKKYMFCILYKLLFFNFNEHFLLINIY